MAHIGRQNARRYWATFVRSMRFAMYDTWPAPVRKAFEDVFYKKIQDPALALRVLAFYKATKRPLDARRIGNDVILFAGWQAMTTTVLAASMTLEDPE